MREEGEGGIEVRIRGGGIGVMMCWYLMCVCVLVLRGRVATILPVVS